jgi:hypothetical protein
MVVVVVAVAVMAVVAMVEIVVAIMDVIVRSVTSVTKLGISHENAKKTLIVVIVAMGLVTLHETAAKVRTNHLAIHATELVIWHVIVQMLRVVVAEVVVVIVIVVTVIVAIEIMIDQCLVIRVTRADTFHVIVQMVPSHVTTVATRDISVVNAPKMVAETNK